MHTRSWLVLVLVSWSGCGANQEACREVACSNRGRCVVTSTGAPTCDCNPGNTAVGLTCVPDSSPGPGPSCAAVGATCARNGDCCNFLAGDGFCVSGRCADSCSSNGQCNSGCCAPLVGGGSSCSSPSACTSCVPVNRACSKNGDCCNFLAGDGWCVDGFCADACTRNSECVSNCCAPLVQGGSTCAGPSWCG